MTVIFYCYPLLVNIGVPGVNQSMIANMRKYGNKDIRVIASNFRSYYDFEWTEEGKEIKVTELNEDQLDTPQLVVFSGFDSYLKVTKNLLKWKMKGCSVAFWTWGFFTRQQSMSNWENGKTPKWLKWGAIKFKKLTLGPLIDYYLVSGEHEQQDSKLDSAKCVEMPMGRPQSAILDFFDNKESEIIDYRNESLNYLGRGKWLAKGLADIVKYANTDIGKTWIYRFFISSKDSDFDEQVAKNKADHIQWYFDVFGEDNLQWLYRSAAVIAPSRNPVQTRVAYEALYTGAPLVVLREGFMDGFKYIFDQQKLENAVQIIQASEFEECVFNIDTMCRDDRQKIAEVAKVVLSPKVFCEWLSVWLLNSDKNKNYYRYVNEKIEDGKNSNSRETNKL